MHRAFQSKRNTTFTSFISFSVAENGDGKGLPSLPADYLAYDNYEEYPEDEGFFQGPIEPYELDADGRPRVPLIHLAQAGQPPPLDVSELGSYPMQQYRLSTISEKSERTEASRHWPSKQQLYAHNDPVPASPMSSYTSYGQLIGVNRLFPLYSRA